MRARSVVFGFHDLVPADRLGDVPVGHRPYAVDPEDFRSYLIGLQRAGRRAGSSTLVVHLWVDADAEEAPVRVGFTVSKAVGNAVTRNRVKRRLRHLTRDRLTSLPGSAVLVVRALPAAAAASSRELDADLDRCLRRALVQPEAEVEA